MVWHGSAISNRSRLVALLLCFFFGIFGIHRFYLRRPISGLITFLTLGFFGLWTLIDLLLIIFGVIEDNRGRAVTLWFPEGSFAALSICVVLIGSGLFFLSQIVRPGVERLMTMTGIEVTKQPTWAEGMMESLGRLAPRNPLETPKPVFRYQDKEGRAFYVDSIDKVPPEYRSQVATEHSLPEIIRVPQKKILFATEESH